MAFTVSIVTNAGLTLLNQAVAGGGAITITKVTAGSGYVSGSDNPALFSNIKSYVMDASLTSFNAQVLFQTTVRASVNSSLAPSTFQLNEVGVWAQVGTGAAVLFAYFCCDGPDGDTITASGTLGAVVRQFALLIAYSQSVPVTCTVTLTPAPELHAITNTSIGTDPIALPTSTHSGLVPTTPADTTQVLLGGATAAWGPIPIYAGSMLDFAGVTAPPTWLLCDGSAYSTTAFPALFAAIQYRFGGSGTTFNVPDCRGRTVVGAGAGAGLTARTLATTGGEETVTLSTTQIPAHSHSISDPGHDHNNGNGNYTNSWSGLCYDHIHSITDQVHDHNTVHGYRNVSASYAGYAIDHYHLTSDPGHGHSFFGQWDLVNTLWNGTTGSFITMGLAGGNGPKYEAGPLAYTGNPASGSPVYPAATGLVVEGSNYGGGWSIPLNLNESYTGITTTNYSNWYGTTASKVAGWYVPVMVNYVVTGITGTNANTGGGGSHDNMPPWIAISKIIKT